MAGAFSGLDKTNPSRDTEFVKPGRYVMRVEGYTHNKTNRNGRISSFFTFLTVAVLDNSAGAAHPGGSHRVGDKATWMLMADVDASGPALVAAMLAVTGLPQTELDDAAYQAFGAAAQPLRGIFVEVDSKQITTKKGAPFTLVKIKRAITDDEVKTLVPVEVQKSLKLELK
jgi:hypothetical protein